MKAQDAIQLVVEGKAPEGWSTTRGVYANLSNYPREIQYYVKCPKCGLVHGDFKSLKDAHGKRLCDLCNLEAINKLKDEIQKVIHDPEHKPKEMAKIVGEALEPFDPFDSPPEGEGLPPPPPEDEPFLEPSDTKGEIERLLLGNWVDRALREFAAEEGHDLTDVEVDEHWGQGDYDPDNLEETTRFKVDIGRNTEWLIFKDDDTARNYALEVVRSDLENEPGIFTRDWLRQFVDEDKLRAAIGDPHEEWEDDIRNLDYDELLDKMAEEGYVDDGDEQFYDEDGDHREETPELYKALDAIRDNFIEREKPSWEPWDWLEDIYGKEQAQEEAIKLAGIDVDKAAEDAVATDGWQHFVARYDHNSHDLEDGAVYCRIN